MSKWNIFKRSKKQEKEPETIEITDEEDQEITHIYADEEPEEQKENNNLAEYNETLNTNKKQKTFINKEETEEKEGYIEDEIDNEQRHWRDIDTIEKEIDELHITKAKKPKTNVEKTVDNLIEKNKKKK